MIIVTAISSIGALVWAVLSDWGPFLFPMVFVTVASGLYIQNQVSHARQRGYLKDDTKLRAALSGWLMERGYHVAQEQQVSSDLTIALSIRDPQQRPYFLYKERARPESFRISAGMRFAPKDVETLNKAPDRTRRELVSHARVEAARFGLDYQGFSWPFGEKTGMAIEVPLDATFSQSVFLERLGGLRNGIITAAEVMVEQLLAEAETPGEEADTGETNVRGENPPA